MNERIKELEKQAGMAYRLGPVVNIAENSTHTFTELYVYDNFDPEKFADLIVRECCQVGGPEDSYTDEWFKAKVNSVAKIRKHFGIE